MQQTTKMLNTTFKRLREILTHHTMESIIAVVIVLCVAFVALAKANAKSTTQSPSIDYAKYRAMYAKPVEQWAKPTLDKSVESEWEEFAPLPKTAPFPNENPYSYPKKTLGEKLFNDTRLSKSGQFACASCHHKELGYSDGMPNSMGHNGQKGRRNAPNIEMSGFFPLLFWDGRAQGLEAQALGPMIDPVEMANTLKNAEKSIKEASEYYALFVASFGDSELQKAWALSEPNAFKEAKGEDYERFVQEHLQEDFGDNAQDLDSGKSSQKSSLDSKVKNLANEIKQESKTPLPKTTRDGKIMPQSADDSHSKLSHLPPLKRDEVKAQAQAVFGNKAFHKLTRVDSSKIDFSQDTSNNAIGDFSTKSNPKSALKTITKSATKTPAKPLSRANIARAKSLITIENITKAIATYERTLVPQNTRFNRFLKGEYSALSDKELFGLDIFRNKGECMNCHYGAILSDKKFHNIGVAFYGRGLEDLGRYEVSQNPLDSGAFRTPSLVNVGKSAPYLHNGISPNLVGLIHLYDAAFPFADTKRFSIGYDASGDNLAPKLDPLIRELKLSVEEIEALEAFLLTL
ncbi:cytochrome-c peroxidase [Helicobacter sp. T3_23-1056]